MDKPPVLINDREGEGLLLHYSLIVRQLAALHDCILHLIRLKQRAKKEEYPIKRAGYIAYAQTELADILYQTIQLCRHLGLNPKDTIEMGKTRYDEKMKKFKEKYPQEEWI
jgi:hypothetical protein